MHLFALLLSLGAYSPAPPPRYPTGPGCGDLLARLGKKPPHVVYAGCRYDPKDQGKPLTATYRVPGPFAAATEAYVIRTFHHARLKKICCYWGTEGSAQIKDRQGRDTMIVMASGETVNLTRASWPRITSFEIEVKTYTEEI